MLQQSDIDAIRHKPVTPRKLLINGDFVPSMSGEQLTILSPIDGSELTTIASAGQDDVDAAVTAARKSFESGVWSNASPDERKKVLFRLAELIEQHALELAVLGVRDNGTEIRMAMRGEPGSAAATFRFYAEAIDKVHGEVANTAQNYFGMAQRERALRLLGETRHQQIGHDQTDHPIAEKLQTLVAVVDRALAGRRTRVGQRPGQKFQPREVMAQSFGELTKVPGRVPGRGPGGPGYAIRRHRRFGCIGSLSARSRV